MTYYVSFFSEYVVFNCHALRKNQTFYFVTSYRGQNPNVIMKMEFEVMIGNIFHFTKLKIVAGADKDTFMLPMCNYGLCNQTPID